jgi:NADPH:quinone reductase
MMAAPQNQYSRSMRAIVIDKFGGPEVLAVREVAIAEPGRGEVRVRVRATAVNRADLLQRMGHYPAPADAPADIPGLEFAGEIAAIGPGVAGVEDLEVGQRVFGLCGGGGYAEQLLAPARAVATIPDALDFVQAAAVPEAFITAYDAMVSQARLRAGETVLIHAVGSGVGTAAVQLARAHGALSVGTSRTASKLQRASELGLDIGIEVHDGRFAAAVKKQAGRVDVVLELVGGRYLDEDLACAAPQARIVVVGLMAGVRSELDMATLLRNRLELRGTVLRSRPIEEKIAAMRSFRRHVVPLLARGQLRPVVDRTFALDEAAAAHEYVQSNRGFGKVVLTM